MYFDILFCRNPMSNLVKPGSRVNQLQQNRPLPTERRSHVRVRWRIHAHVQRATDMWKRRQLVRQPTNVQR